MQQAHTRSFDTLPDDAWIRESQLIQGRRGSNPLAPLPFSSPTLWRKVRAGTFPAPTKLSERVAEVALHELIDLLVSSFRVPKRH